MVNVYKMNEPTKCSNTLPALTTSNPGLEGRIMAEAQPIHAHSALQVKGCPVEYRDIPGFPGYRVGSDGTIWTFWGKQPLGQGKGSKTVLRDKCRELKPILKANGYRQASLTRDGKRHVPYVHYLVLLAFVGPRPEGMWVAHNNGNPQDNRLDNLRYDTPRNNQADKVAHGTINRGERNYHAKITREIAIEIRRLSALGMGPAAIARRLDTTDSIVRHVVSGRRWAWIDDAGCA